MSVYFEMTLIAILDTKRGSHAPLHLVFLSPLQLLLFLRSPVRLSESDSAVRVSGLLVALGASLLWHAMLWTWARCTLSFSFLSYKMGRDAATHKTRSLWIRSSAPSIASNAWCWLLFMYFPEGKPDIVRVAGQGINISVFQMMKLA